MHYEIEHLSIDENSVEGKNLKLIMNRDGVDACEAVRRVLRNLASGPKSPAEELIGLFSSEEDSQNMDKAMELVKERRKLDGPRDLAG